MGTKSGRVREKQLCKADVKIDCDQRCIYNRTREPSNNGAPRGTGTWRCVQAISAYFLSYGFLMSFSAALI